MITAVKKDEGVGGGGVSSDECCFNFSFPQGVRAHADEEWRDGEEIVSVCE